MKLTFAKSNKTTKRLLVFFGLIVLCAGVLASGLAVDRAKAAPGSLSYNDFRSKIDPKAQSYCTPVKNDKHAASNSYNGCINTYVQGASFVYYASSDAAINKSIQTHCTPPPINFTTAWASTQISACGAYATGATTARNMLGPNQNSPASGGSQNQSSQQNQAPPISKCDTYTNNAADKRKCIQAYRNCNQSSFTDAQIAQCKTKTINIYKNNQKPAAKKPAKPAAKKPAKSQPKQAAQNPSNQGDPAIDCSSGNCDLIAKYVNPAINLFSLVFGLIAVISMILGGIQYAASEGDPQKAAKAKSRLYNTLIAIFAYLFLYAFLQFLIPGGAFR